MNKDLSQPQNNAGLGRSFFTFYDMGDFLVFFTISTNTEWLQMLQFTYAFGKLFLFAVLCMLVIIESALHIIRCQS